MAKIRENSGSTFIAAGGELGIRVRSNVTWDFKLKPDESKPTWLNIKNSLGENTQMITGSSNAVITLTAEENEDVENRYCTGYCTSLQTEDKPYVVFEQYGSYFYINGTSAATDVVSSARTENKPYIVDTSYLPADIVIGKDGYETMVESYSLSDDATKFYATYVANRNEYDNVLKFRFKNRKTEKELATLQVTQMAKAFFRWGTSSVRVGSGETSSTTVSFSTNYLYSGLSFVGDGTVVTNATRTSTRVRLYCAANTQTSERNGWVEAYYNGQSLGRVTVTQDAVPFYFKWENGSTTYTVTVGNIAGNKSVGLETNYNINDLNFTPDTSSGIVNGSPTATTTSLSFNYVDNPVAQRRNGYIRVTKKNGGDTVATLNIEQEAQVFTFKWNDNGQSEYTINVGTSSAVTSAISYTTNYSGLTFTPDGSIVSSVSTGTNSITVTYTMNPTESERTGSVAVKSNGTGIGNLTVKQTGQSFSFIWTDSGSENLTVAGQKEGGTKNAAYQTNYSGLTFVADGTVITNATDRNGSVDFTYGENTGTTTRTGSIKVMSGSTRQIGTLTLNQSGQDLMFIWSNSSSTKTVTGLDAAGGSFVENFKTNHTGVTFTWSGAVTSVVNNSNTSVTVTYSENTTTSTRPGGVFAKNGAGDVIGEMSVSQNGVGYNFSWNQTTYNVNSGDSSTVAAFTTNYNLSDLTFTYNGMITSTGNLTTTSITVNYGANQTKTGRTGTITAKYGSENLGSCTINQAAMAYFNWTNSPVSVGSGITSATLTYSSNYATRTFSKSGIITSVTDNNNGTVTVTFPANTSTSTSTGTVTAFGETATVNQAGKAYLTWNPTSYTVNSTATSVVGTYTTNCNTSQLTFEKASTGFVSSFTSISTTSVTINFSVNTGALRNDSIIAKVNGVVVSTNTASITQSAASFVVNLKVNGSTSPADIAWDTTSFTITTQPNVLTQQYTIKVNGVQFASATGNYTGTYTCGSNTGSIRNFVVECGGESVTIRQEGKPVPTGREIVITGSAPWWVKFNNTIVDEQSIDFTLSISGAENHLTGDAHGFERGDDYQFSLLPDAGHGITFRTTNMEEYYQEIRLTIESGNRRCAINPVNGSNPHSFSGGEIGGGSSGYETTGTIRIPAGTTDISLTLDETKWETSDI